MYCLNVFNVNSSLILLFILIRNTGVKRIDIELIEFKQAALMKIKLVFLLSLVFYSLRVNTALNKRASLTYNNGEVWLTSDKGKDVVLQPGQGGRVRINGAFFNLRIGPLGKPCNGGNRGIVIYRNGTLQICDGVRYVSMTAKLGSAKNPAASCKAILEDDWSAPSGVYYIKTDPIITKVYCYMEHIPGCGGGGWTTVMKTNGYLPTFRYDSVLWRNKVPYHLMGGQSGVDHQETKLPTYWTMPFSSLCLGMRTSFQSKPRWIRLNYGASSLYSVIADGRYRRFSIGRNAWKSLIPGSSLQRNCNREGFNVFVGKYQYVRIGVVSNQENECLSPDSRIGFGGAGSSCSTDNSISTGNTANCSPDNGVKNIRSHGYILAQ